MPSIFTHPVPVIALAAGLGKNIIPNRLAVAAVTASVLPDLDVVGFAFGVRYTEALGHRGFSHSLAFALAVAAAAFRHRHVERMGRPARNGETASNRRAFITVVKQKVQERTVKMKQGG